MELSTIRVSRISILLCIVFVLILMQQVSIVTSSLNSSGLLIVTSFPNLAWDIRKIVCKGDVIKSIAPVGVDPHEYQLTPSDIELLRKADIIISTAHTPFEKDIREQVAKGEVNAFLVEIPRIPGIRILINPATRLPNYHMPIYDPGNYIIFLKYLVKVFSERRPECSSHYAKKAEETIGLILRTVSLTPKLNITVAADSPLTQYAVSWAGIKIKYLLVKEHGTAASPNVVRAVENALKSRSVGAVVITWPPRSKASEILLDMASRYNIPIVKVPSPFMEGTIPEKLMNISTNIRSIAEAVMSYGVINGEAGREKQLLIYSGIFVVLSLALLVYHVIKER